MAEKQTDVTRGESRLARQEPTLAPNPFRVLDRFATEMDRLFDSFGFGRGLFAPRFGTELLAHREIEEFFPELDVFQRGEQLVIRADLPGLTRKDVKVTITDEAVTIQGERRREREEAREGVFRSERSYGSFLRSVTLPEGAMADQAKAIFKDGVLEITMPTPPASLKLGREIEIAEAPAEKK